MSYLASFVLCFFITALSTPHIIKLAHYLKAVDEPNERKVHHTVMPRLGGLAIFVSVIIGYMVFDIRNIAFDTEANSFLDAYLIASVLIVFTGVLDDIYELPAKPKFIVQLVAALIMVIYGDFLIQDIYLPFLPEINLGWLSGVVTVIWIIGVTNSINLIDGLDGLSSGISSIAFGTMAFIAVLKGEVFVSLMCAMLMGSSFGFLVYNFYPARIFMGDTGSLFLGFSIAVFSLLGYKNTAFVSFIVPLMLVSIPIFDTVWAIIRRLLKGQSPFKADKGHVHHQLLDKHCGHIGSVLILYSISLMFSIIAIIYSLISKNIGLILIVIGLVVVELVFNTTGVFVKRKREPENKKS